MDEKWVAHYFLKEAEITKTPIENVSSKERHYSKDWVILCMDGSKAYIKLICEDDPEPSQEEKTQLLAKYNCKDIFVFFYLDHKEMRRVLATIGAGIYWRPVVTAEDELRWKRQEEKEKREHEAAVIRKAALKAEKQRLAEIRREKQLEKARLWHLEHDK